MEGRKEVKARAVRCAHMARKYRSMRQFGAAAVKYGQLLGICSALASWGDGSHDAGYWFGWMVKQSAQIDALNDGIYKGVQV